MNGKLDREEYPLTSKLAVIGNSQMASIRLRGWLKRSVAAQINRLEDGYYLGVGDRVPRVNGAPVTGSTLLRDGDLIDICDVQLRFVIHK